MRKKSVFKYCQCVSKGHPLKTKINFIVLVHGFFIILAITLLTVLITCSASKTVCTGILDIYCAQCS